METNRYEAFDVLNEAPHGHLPAAVEDRLSQKHKGAYLERQSREKAALAHRRYATELTKVKMRARKELNKVLEARDRREHPKPSSMRSATAWSSPPNLSNIQTSRAPARLQARLRPDPDLRLTPMSARRKQISDASEHERRHQTHLRGVISTAVAEANKVNRARIKKASLLSPAGQPAEAMGETTGMA
ncbi:hypothetical protein J8273_0230 [Carpediemonas membranifera]|uniref:Uncharacterized protein n=1 Tax=Carpediemonas membranifera TaxID=201153 RepID=A0A8J6E2S1_9EUKA|nr:hypothetical protein J8273_0230 [Carpediemonas membranifera]|eukprot:KAG9395018.1 hypothetical protein J8273_0230 [Carpediemonas membranifera]